MVARTVKRFYYGTLGALGVAFALFAFNLLSRTAQDASQFDRWQELILLINIAGVFVLLALFIGNLTRLVREYRTHVPGA
jgi:hypothetical protein